MATQNFGADQGFRIYDANTDVFVDIIKISGAPTGTGVESDAPIGSISLRTDTGEFYKKIANAGAPADWKRMASEDATDMFLTSSYDPTTNGVPADGQSLELAIGFLDANQLDLITLTGVAKGDVDLGNFTGNVIPPNLAIKPALQSLETAIDNISGGGKDQELGVTAATRVGDILVDSAFQAEWEVVVEESADPSNRISIKLNALHDGTAGADATTVDVSRFARNRVGSNFNYTVDITLSGAGPAQVWGVEASSTEPSGVNVYIRRTQLP